MNVATVDQRLPELLPFARELGEAYTHGALTGWPMIADRVRRFFTPERMAATEAVLPGWTEMASYADGTTLIHVVTVLTALLLCPEYARATAEQQALMHWIVLFHDLEKKIAPGKRDFRHGFRSAATTGKTLPRLGFALRDESGLDEWARLTWDAIRLDAEGKEEIHDNSQLPAIIGGVERTFGRATPAGLIVDTVLLHMSITVLAEWPQPAPLTDEDIGRYVHPALLPLLEIMYLVDNDAWAFFEPERKQHDREATLAAFARIRRLLGMAVTS